MYADFDKSRLSYTRLLLHELYGLSDRMTPSSNTRHTPRVMLTRRGNLDFYGDGAGGGRGEAAQYLHRHDG